MIKFNSRDPALSSGGIRCGTVSFWADSNFNSTLGFGKWNYALVQDEMSLQDHIPDQEDSPTYTTNTAHPESAGCWRFHVTA